MTLKRLVIPENLGGRFLLALMKSIKKAELSVT